MHMGIFLVSLHVPKLFSKLQHTSYITIPPTHPTYRGGHAVRDTLIKALALAFEHKDFKGYIYIRYIKMRMASSVADACIYTIFYS